MRAQRRSGCGQFGWSASVALREAADFVGDGDRNSSKASYALGEPRLRGIVDLAASARSPVRFDGRL